MHADLTGETHLSRWRWALVVVFVLLGSLVLRDLAHYRGDEHFYSDASLEMLRSGDYLTPKFDEGSDRFNKPILNYWLIVTSYKIFGTGVFATRLPALLAGAGLILLMWPLAMALFSDRRLAILSMAIMACTDQVMSTSIRATTDIVLVCFMTMSLVGMAQLVIQGRRNAGSYALFYFGAALAILTKGGWGIMPVVVGYALVAVLGRRWEIRLRDLIHWPIMLGALLVAASWFIMIFAVHGPTALKLFFADQAGVRMGAGEDGATRWKNVVTYFTTIPLQMLPWSVLAIIVAIADRAAVRVFWVRYRKSIVTVAIWGVVILVPLLFANIVRPRYVLMIFPMLAAMLAAFILQVESLRADFEMFLRRGIPRLLGLVGLLAALFALWCVQIDWRLAASGIVIAIACLIGRAAARWQPPVKQLLVACIVIMVSVRAHELLGYQVFAQSPVPEMASVLRETPRGSIVGVAEELELSAQMRMYVGLDFVVQTIRPTESAVKVAERRVVWLRADDPRAPIDHHAHPVIHSYRNLRNRHILGVLLHAARKDEILADRLVAILAFGAVAHNSEIDW